MTKLQASARESLGNEDEADAPANDEDECALLSDAEGTLNDT